MTLAVGWRTGLEISFRQGRGSILLLARSKADAGELQLQLLSKAKSFLTEFRASPVEVPVEAEEGESHSILTPIKSREYILDYVKDALNRIRNAGVKVKYLLFDGGFSSLGLPPYLEANGYQYAIRVTPNSLTKRMRLRDGQSAVYPCDRPFRIVRADDKTKKKKKKKKKEGDEPFTYLFATNMICKARRILRRYKNRWGVETTYRKHNEFLARTTSKNYVVRLLYYAVSICIYNVWCLFNVYRRHVIVLEAKVRLLLSSSLLASTIAFLRPG